MRCRLDSLFSPVPAHVRLVNFGLEIICHVIVDCGAGDVDPEQLIEGRGRVVATSGTASLGQVLVAVITHAHAAHSTMALPTCNILVQSDRTLVLGLGLVD